LSVGAVTDVLSSPGVYVQPKWKVAPVHSHLNNARRGWLVAEGKAVQLLDTNDTNETNRTDSRTIYSGPC